MEKQKFNLHTHTARCGHAQGLDIQYIESAITAGFTQLGFSEHIPYIEMRLPDCRMFYEQKNEYLNSLKELQKRYHNQIDIKIGYEVEYMDDYYDYLMDMKKECDYMILGQHCKFIGYEYDCYCSDEDVLFYVEQIEKALAKGFITYVAHPDYFMLGRRMYNEVCVEAAHRIAKASIQYDVPLEINLNGFHYGKKSYHFFEGADTEERYPYPFREFWEIVEAYGCKVVYGYDAHTPIAFQETNRMDRAKEVLEGLKLNYVNTIRLR